MARGCTRVIDAQRYTLDAICRSTTISAQRSADVSTGTATRPSKWQVKPCRTLPSPSRNERTIFLGESVTSFGLTLSLEPAATLAAPPPAPVPFDPQARINILDLETVEEVVGGTRLDHLN